MREPEGTKKESISYDRRNVDNVVELVRQRNIGEYSEITDMPKDISDFRAAVTEILICIGRTSSPYGSMRFEHHIDEKETKYFVKGTA